LLTVPYYLFFNLTCHKLGVSDKAKRRFQLAVLSTSFSDIDECTCRTKLIWPSCTHRLMTSIPTTRTADRPTSSAASDVTATSSQSHLASLTAAAAEYE